MDRPGHVRIKPPKAPPGPNGRGGVFPGRAVLCAAANLCRGRFYIGPASGNANAPGGYGTRPCGPTANARTPWMAAPPQGSNFGNTHALKTPQKGRPPCQKQGAAFAFFLRVSRAPAPARRCGPKFRQGRQPFSGAGATKKWPLSKRPLFLEVTTRFELVNEGFADPCLTTWPRHHINKIPVN